MITSVGGSSSTPPARWLRDRQHIFYLADYGVVDDGYEASPTDNLPKVQACLADLYTATAQDPIGQPGLYRGGVIVWPGHTRRVGAFYLSGPIVCERQVVMCGAGGTGMSTYLYFKDHTDGLVFTRYNDGAYGKELCAGSVVRDLAIVGPNSHPAYGNAYRPPVAQYSTLIGGGSGHDPMAGSGIIIRCPQISVENVAVIGFDFDGICIDSTDQWTNANGAHVRNVFIKECGRHGVYLNGVNGNACDIQGLNVASCGGWGIYDRSFLGNTYIGCQVATCGYLAHDVVGIAGYNLIPGSGHAAELEVALADGGVWQTFNGGTTWVHLEAGLEVEGFCPAPSCLVRFATGPADRYIWVGTDAGVWYWDQSVSPPNWVQIPSGMTDLDVKALCAKAGAVYAATPTGIYKSTDYSTWSLLSGTAACTALSFDKDGDLLAGFATAIKRSTDGGASFSTIQATSGAVVAIHAVADEILVGTLGDGAYSSTDNGSTWDHHHASLDVRAVQISPKDGDWYVGSDAGLRKSTDNGSAWSLITSNMAYSTDVRAIFCDAKVADDVWIGLHNTTTHQLYQRGGVMRSRDGGTTLYGQAETGNALWAGGTFVGGGIKALSAGTALTAFLGCYIEGDNIVECDSTTVVIGGEMAYQTRRPRSTAKVIDPARGGLLDGQVVPAVQLITRGTADPASTVLQAVPDLGAFDVFMVDAYDGNIQLLLQTPDNYPDGKRVIFRRAEVLDYAGSSWDITIRLANGQPKINASTQVKLPHIFSWVELMVDSAGGRFCVLGGSSDLEFT